jgi:hypothetical protein
LRDYANRNGHGEAQQHLRNSHRPLHERELRSATRSDPYESINSEREETGG